MIKNILLRIEYDGSCFSGWQRQPEKRTVQGELENALKTLLRQHVDLSGTGRTDAGVHAAGQCASFTADVKLPTGRMAAALNDILAESRLKAGAVRIISAEEVPDGFSARFSAVGKTYIYRIFNGENMYVFLRNYRYNVKRSLNFEDMLKAAGYIRGTHDFKAFEAAGGTPGKSTVRNIYEIDINIIAHENLYSCGYSIDNEKTGAYDIEIVVTGDGFLYNMVRIIAGTLVDVGLGRIRAGSIEDIINSGDRSRAGHTAPAQGLCMQEVYFSMEDLNRGIFRYGRKS